jgi:hypothetical protein
MKLQGIDSCAGGQISQRGSDIRKCMVQRLQKQQQADATCTGQPSSCNMLLAAVGGAAIVVGGFPALNIRCASTNMRTTLIQHTEQSRHVSSVAFMHSSLQQNTLHSMHAGILKQNKQSPVLGCGNQICRIRLSIAWLQSATLQGIPKIVLFSNEGTMSVPFQSSIGDACNA